MIAQMEKDIEPLAQHLGTYCGIADRNCAGLTEMSTRIRKHENWYMDTVLDPEGVEEPLPNRSPDTNSLTGSRCSAGCEETAIWTRSSLHRSATISGPKVPH